MRRRPQGRSRGAGAHSGSVARESTRERTASPKKNLTIVRARKATLIWEPNVRIRKPSLEIADGLSVQGEEALSADVEAFRVRVLARPVGLAHPQQDAANGANAALERL